MKFRVMIAPDEDGVFIAAQTGYLTSLACHGEPVPSRINEEIVEIPT